MKHRLLATAAVILLLTALMPRPLAAGASVPYRSYTYDSAGRQQETPPLYLPETLWQGDLVSPTDLEIFEAELYLLDGVAGRIVVTDLALESARDLPLWRSMGEPMVFEAAAALFVGTQGIYVSDTRALAIYSFDHAGYLQQTLTVPDSPLYDDAIPFRVRRVLADGAGNVYALVDGMYAGAVLFSPQGEFLGFYGANEVVMTVDKYIEQLWKQLLSAEQRAAMSRFVPVAYTSFDIDDEDFIYTCTDAVSLPSARVRKLNPSGRSLWNDGGMVYGDDFDEAQFVEGVQNATSFLDIAVDDAGILSVLDAAKGRVFQYDATGEIMGVFGGKGNQIGTFSEPIAIDAYGERLYVLDGKEAAVTVFSLTEYGAAYRRAVILYHDGEYLAALPYWREVLRQNPFAQNACVGIGKALYAAGDVEGAMTYLSRSGDKEQTSLVFARYRLSFVRAHFGGIVLGAGGVAVALWLAARLLRGRGLAPLNRHLAVVLHPGEELPELQRSKGFSLFFSGGVALAWLGIDVLKFFATGVLFQTNNPRSFQLFSVLMSTVLLLLFWTVVNWSISSLSDGKGTAKDIFCATTYALIPYLASQVLSLLFSRILTLEESAFLTWITGAGVLWSGILLFANTMTIHHYTFGKTMGNLLLTALGIVIVLLLLFGLVVLFEQVSNLFTILYNEITLRQ